MKFLKRMKDGGKESRVWGVFLVEAKAAFSVVLLQFLDGSREAYHTHAFNAVSWVLRGRLSEDNLEAGTVTEYTPSWRPIYTPRRMFHKVSSTGTTWVISFRGPWAWTWKEYLPDEGRFVAYTHGRRIIPDAQQA